MRNKLLYIILIVVFVACGDYDPEINTSASISTFSSTEIADLRGFTTFNDAVTHSGIASELTSGSVTMLVPTNEAFATLLAEFGVSRITDIEAGVLADILKYHVLPEALLSTELAKSNTTLLEGKSVYLSTDISVEDSVGLNGKATVIDANIVSSDGIIHGISVVLEIPEDNVMDILRMSEDHTNLVTELERTELDETLSGTTEYTVMAPNNDAITVAGIAALSVKDATRALRFHVFPGRVHSVEFPDNDRLATILGTQDSNNKQEQEQEVNIEELGFNGEEVDSANYSAENGLVHFVGGVIEREDENIDFIPADWLALIDALDPSVKDSYENLDTLFSFMAFDGPDPTDPSAPVAPTVASFGGDTDAIADWLAMYTWDGQLALRGLDSGTKLQTGNADAPFYFWLQYTEAIDPTIGSPGSPGSPAFTINGETYLSSISQSTYNGYRNRFFFGSYPTPLPDSTISEILAEKTDYQLIGKAIEVAGKKSQVDTESTTFYAVQDQTFTDLFEYTSVAHLDTLSLQDENDEDVLEDFIDFFDAHTIPGVVEGELIISLDLPIQTNSSDDDVVWGKNADGDPVIITDVQDPFNSTVQVEYFDFWAKNGVIHVIGGSLVVED